MIASYSRRGRKNSERSFALLLLAVACKRDADPPPKPAPPAHIPVAPQIIEVALGPAELLPADGAPMEGSARLPLLVGDKAVTWTYDRGTFVYDENANGDLTDDPKHALDTELTLTLHVAGEIKGSLHDAPVRIRKRADGALFLQAASVRRGTIPLAKGAMQVAALGDMGQFGLDYQLVAFDVDRDGKLDLQTIDAPEQIRVFEGSVNLDDSTYAFSVEPDGSSLTLVPSAKRLPDRPRLTVGSQPPDVALTAFDGTKLKLSDLRGKVVLVDFWATMCKPCVQSLPRLAELRAKYAPKGFELVAIAMPSDDIQAVLADHKAGIETADDAAQTAFRVDRFPTYFLLDKDGTIACSRCTLDATEAMIVKKLGD